MDETVAVQEGDNIYHAIKVEKQNKAMSVVKEKKERTWALLTADYSRRVSHKNATAYVGVTWVLEI